MYNRTLLVFKYLWETTDEEHTASLADITAYLQGCGIPKPDARTLRKDIDQLIEFGIDIVHHRGIQNRYHVATRHFEAPELKLLIDAVQSSWFVTPKKSKALIGKLAAFAEPSQSELLNRELYVDSRYKSGNESIYLAVDSIQTAIEQKKKISFQYFDYAPDKTKLLRHDGLVAMDERGMISYDSTEIMTEKIARLTATQSAEVYTGSIPCGTPETVEAMVEGYVSLPVSIFGSDEMYILRTRGDSMIEAGIEEGDYVVIKKQSTASIGEIVVALHDNENTLKTLRYDRKRRKYILHPENSEMEDIVVDDLTIQGVAKFVIKPL